MRERLVSRIEDLKKGVAILNNRIAHHAEQLGLARSDLIATNAAIGECERIVNEELQPGVSLDDLQKALGADSLEYIGGQPDGTST